MIKLTENKFMSESKTTKQYKNYLVGDIELLYKIAGAGLLDKLRGTGKNKHEPFPVR